MRGRKNTFAHLEQHLSQSDRVLWFHCASLGEFEQGRPLIEKIKNQHPQFTVVLSFFSPSGYEVQKDYKYADIICYLPLDSQSNAKRFLDLVKPEIAVFVKYEFWPNFLKALRERQIKTLLISGIFRKEQLFFKGYGTWMRKSLKSFDHFFVQNDQSKKLLNNIGFENVTISGDTRFDRVYAILNQENDLEGLENFTKNAKILVAGSTWPEDEKLLVNYVNFLADKNEKFIIAPHLVDSANIDRLARLFKVKTRRYSKVSITELPEVQVLIIDSIGLLTKLYSYATIAYVGGAFKTGLHNVLEPATFGVPILIGPQYTKFEEAKELVALGACIVVSNQAELNQELKTLYLDQNWATKKGTISKNFVKNKIGATNLVLKYLESSL